MSEFSYQVQVQARLRDIAPFVHLLFVLWKNLTSLKVMLAVKGIVGTIHVEACCLCVAILVEDAVQCVEWMAIEKANETFSS